MREVRKWEIRVGFAEEKTYKQRPGAADGRSLEDPGEELSRQREEQGQTCPGHGRKCGWNRVIEESMLGAGIRQAKAGRWGLRAPVGTWLSL